MKKVIGIGLLAFTLTVISLPAHAASTTLSLSAISNSDSVRVRVTGAPNSPVAFLYYIGNNRAQPLDLGKTDDAGTLTTSISASANGVNTDRSVYVTVGGVQSSYVSWPVPAGTDTGADFTLGLDHVDVTEGGVTVVPVYSLGSGSIAVSANSNASVAQITVNGSQVSVKGLHNGTDTVTLCLSGSTSHCQTLSITVGTSTTQSFSLSNANPALAVGQTLTVSLNGAVSGTFYISSNSNQSAVQANISYNLITLIGSHAGTSTITVCKNSGGCVTFTATVLGVAGGTNAAPALSPTHISIAVGQSTTVLVAGKGGYFISNNNNPDVAQATVSGSGIVVKGLVVGSRIVSLCDSSDQCSTLTITVTNVPPPAPTPTPTPAPSTTYQFTTNIAPGDSGLTVTALQGVLKVLGFLTATPNGYYGPATKAAVMAFQAAHNIQTLGSVGPATRAALNALTGSTAGGSSTTSGSTPTPGTTHVDTYIFTEFMNVGSTGTGVTELQKRLATLGYFSGSATGTYGPLTKAAVIAFQTARGITPAGYVGPATRAALNGS